MIDFDKKVDRKNTNSYKWDKYPDGVLPLWVADMDFEVDYSIILALQKIVDHGVIGYSRTPDELIDVVIDRLLVRHNWPIKKEWIVWLPGLVPGIYAASKCVSEDNCSVMTSTPVYKPFIDSAKLPNRSFQDIPFIWRNKRWEMDFDSMERAVSENTKLYIFCNPHNPNGRVFSREELTRLAEFCVKNDVFICSDEIHCDLILDENKKHISIASLNPEIENLSITLLAPSKTFNIAGLGCSFAIIPNAELRARFEKEKFGMMPMLSSFAMESALAAYKFGENWLQELIVYLRGNQSYLLEEINKIPGLKMEPLEATYLAWINYEQSGIKNLVEVLEKNGVGVQDASIFGGEGFFRLNFATTRENLKLAVQRIKFSLKATADSEN